MKKYILVLGLLFLPLCYTNADMCHDFAGAQLVSPDGTYLGVLDASKFNTDSIGNKFSNYGSKFNDKSIFNQFGNYGSKFSDTSPRNKFATKPPLIVKGGVTMGTLTLNQFANGAQNTFDILYCFIELSDDRREPFGGLNPGWHALTYTVPGSNIGGTNYNLTEEQSCQIQYGENATAGDPGYCTCKYGYKWNSSQTACIALTDSDWCEVQYGENATAGDPGKCKCKNGYVRSNDKTHCTKMTEDEICQSEYGINSYSPEDGYCNCKVGYEWNSTKTQCVKSNNTVTTNKTNSTNATNSIGGGTPTSNNYITKDEELKIAIQWMYDNGLTMYNQVKDFLPNNEITREQASKFFVEFAAKVLGKERGTISNYNIFSDISKADPTLKNHIIYANNMGLFKGTNGKFNPFNKLTKAQAIAVTVRMANGYMDESFYPRYFNYYYTADAYGILKWGGFDYNTLDSTNISRGDMALILYNLYLYLNK